MSAFHHHVARTSNKALFTLALLSAARLCDATDMYKWKDEAGRTHVAQSVPERYKGVAVKMDSTKFEVEASERAAALARVAKERERAATMATDRERAAEAAAAAASGAGLSAAQSAAEQSAKPGESQCDRLWRVYFESQICFAPYQRHHVGPRVEAYERCPTVQAPPSECGPARVLPH